MTETYWGQPSTRWRVLKSGWRMWDVYDPAGYWSGSFETWCEAITWADPFTRLTAWLTERTQ